MTRGRGVSLIGVLLAIAACSGPSEVLDPPDNIVGVWILQTWDGKPLPAITYGISGGYHEQIVSERFVVSTDGSFSMERTYQYMPEGKSEVQSGTGSWENTGPGSYTIGAGEVPGRMSNDTLSVEWRGDGRTAWVYMRSR